MNQLEKRQRILFQYHAEADSPLGRTFRYLMRNQAISKAIGKERANQAVLSFWLPFAAQSEGVDAATVGQLAQESIQILEAQLYLLRRSFSLEAAVEITSHSGTVLAPAMELSPVAPAAWGDENLLFEDE